MRPQKVGSAELLHGLMAVLRSKGYDGATLNDLAEASGLQKASLYHRFPGGKIEITCAVLDFVAEWVETHVYQVLTNPAVPRAQRLEQALSNMNQLYGNGEQTCILRALTMDSGMPVYGEKIKASMMRLMSGFRFVGQELGQTEERAQATAQQALVLIQGGLVVSKGLGSTEPFQAALQSIRTLYEES